MYCRFHLPTDNRKMISQLHNHNLIGSGYILLQLQGLTEFVKGGIHIRDKLFPVLVCDSKCSPKSGFECSSDIENLMGTVCRLKLNF